MKHIFSKEETMTGSRMGNEAQKKRAQKNLDDALYKAGFQRISDYAGTLKPIDIKCLRCGEIKTRTPYSIKRWGTVCLSCKNNDLHKAKEQTRARQIEEKEQKKRAKEESKRKTINNMLSAQHTCKVCGKPYTIRDYMQSTGMKYARNSGFCSSKCRDKQAEKNKIEAAKRRGTHSEHHYDRAKRLGLPHEKGVTLKKLFIRDKGVCQICQCECYYYGNPLSDLYPSIDHIIPMNNDPEKKGGHTWANVQLAHRLCNSNKRDHVGTEWKNLVPTGKG